MIYRRVTGSEIKKILHFSTQLLSSVSSVQTSRSPSLFYRFLSGFMHLFRMERARTRSTWILGFCVLCWISQPPKVAVKFVPDFLSVAFVRRRTELNIQNESLGSVYSSELTMHVCVSYAHSCLVFPAFERKAYLATEYSSAPRRVLDFL